MAVMRIDEFASKWFEEMDISESQKKKRIEIAEEIDDIMLFFFEEFLYDREMNLDTSHLIVYLQEEIQKVVDRHAVPSQYTDMYIAVVSQQLYNTTIAHMTEKFFTSAERAHLISVNEANSIANYVDLVDAQRKGYLLKKWRTEMDERVRPTHVVKEGNTIPINSYFQFPECQGLFPRDIVNMTPEETCNCRCWLEFLKGNEDDTQTIP